MRMQVRSKHRFNRLGRSLAAVAGLTLALGAPQAQADSGDVGIASLAPSEIPVTSNGSDYTGVAPETNIAAMLHVTADAEVSGNIKWWSAALWIGTSADDRIRFYEYGIGESYSWGHRPNSIDVTELVVVPSTAYEPFLVTRCNDLADRLRKEGLTDKAIFGQDRTFELGVMSSMEFDASGIGNQIVEGNWWKEGTITVRCKKWQGSTAPVANDNIDTQLPEVKDGSLTVIEQYGPSSLCLLKLSGVVETYEANTEVKFRYEDDKGHKSDVKSVKTDHTKTVMFSHEYKIDNNPNGGENGKVRMVGVGNPLKTDWEEYSMQCVEPGATGYTAELAPTVKMQWVVAETKAFPIHDNRPGAQSQLCPVRLKLIGLIEGHGEMSGLAAFVGDNYFSAPKAYEVENGQKVLIGAEREIDWTAALLFSNGPAKRTMTLGFNVTGSDPNNIVASVPKKTEWLTCTQAAVVPGLQGGNGLTVGTRPIVPQAGATKLEAPNEPPGPGTPQTLQIAPRLKSHRLQPN